MWSTLKGYSGLTYEFHRGFPRPRRLRLWVASFSVFAVGRGAKHSMFCGTCVCDGDPLGVCGGVLVPFVFASGDPLSVWGVVALNTVCFVPPAFASGDLSVIVALRVATLSMSVNRPLERRLST